MFTKTLAALAVESGANIVIGSATAINYGDDGKAIKSVQYLDSGTSKTLVATDVLISAGQWTPKIFPRAHLGAPRGHSIVVRPPKDFSPFVLDANIGPAPHGPLKDDLFLEIFPRSGDELNDFNTFYSCGPDDYDVRLPATSDSVEVDEKSCNDIWETLRSFSQEIHDGELITKLACYKAQIRPHGEGRKLNLSLDRQVLKVCGLLLAMTNEAFKIYRGQAWS